MADRVKEPTLELANTDEAVSRMIRKLTGDKFQELAGATFQIFKHVGAQPFTWWGLCKVASEETWLMAKCDIIIQINHDLWLKLSERAREGLLAHFLWRVQKKTGGTSVQRHDDSDRQLYSRRTPTLKVAPQVLAWYPELNAEVEELANLKRALDNPQQFLEFLARGVENEDEDGHSEAA